MTEKQVKRRSPTMSAARIAQVVALMSEKYGPFPAERRLPPTEEMVFTVLSQHTSDINSGRAFARLMERFGTLYAVARGEVSAIEEAIAPGGLAKVKAPRIKQVLEKVLELNGGSLDLSFLRETPLGEAKAWLRQLPGIGPKSAGIVLNFSLGMPAMAIDTHIYRVCQRLRAIDAKTNADKAHDVMEAKVPPDEVFNFHVAFINHGRRVCKAQRPLCDECVVGDMCPSRNKFMSKSAVAQNGTKAGRTTKPATVDPDALPHVPPVLMNAG
jgi:endonuclease-3